ncbi:Translation initiation factor factor eIF-4G [uncultured virus]|nr:Translation initiation factor factor eIF-4G [uncultured virus]
MESNTEILLNMEELYKYKNFNKNPIPEIEQFIKVKNISDGNYKKIVSKNNWVLNKKLNMDDDEKLNYQYRSILNKISDNNLNEMAKEIINLEIKTQDQLCKLVDFIFSKAISESKFCELYAKCSKELSTYYIELDGTKICFRQLLIKKCQIMFNNAINLDKNIENDPSENIFKIKDEILGCISFIGELYKQGLLADRIIYSCFVSLETKTSLNKAYIVDSMCTLMKIVGKFFFKNTPTEANICFSKLEKLKETNISLKEKFFILDIVDLKKKEKW